MQNNKTQLLAQVAQYYTSKLAEHGDSPHGVDWNGEESQTNRFKQLCKLIDRQDQFSINDLGCGYGALYEFLAKQYKNFDYSGIDVSESMVLAATQRYGGEERVHFVLSNEPTKIADYSVASGIFNVRLNRPDAEWRDYLEATLDILDKNSQVGFAFNCLTSYADTDKMRDNLYYADPCALFDFCKRRYSSQVALLHDYGLYEFTVLVRKQQ